MSAPVDVDGFLRRFHRFGAAPSRETYLDLFDPDATLLDAGMERPLTVDEIPAHIEGVLALAPDFRMLPERWRVSGATVFVEAFNRATLAGTPLAWRSVYRVELRGDHVVRGQRYYDRTPLYACLDPTLPPLPPLALAAEPGALTATPGAGVDAAEFVRAYGECWARGTPAALAELYREDGTALVPGAARPLGRNEIAPYYRALAAMLDGLRLERQAWAGDERLVFIAWRATGTLRGQPVRLEITDRFDLVDGRILNARAYCDTLELARVAAAPIAADARRASA